jgi:hypothetical protein
MLYTNCYKEELWDHGRPRRPSVEHFYLGTLNTCVFAPKTKRAMQHMTLKY